MAGPKSIINNSTLQGFQAGSDREIAAIIESLNATMGDQLTNQAKRAIDQALLQMFGGTSGAADMKKKMTKELGAIITRFNRDLSEEFKKLLDEEKEKLRAELKKEIEDMRSGFMNDLKNL